MNLALNPPPLGSPIRSILARSQSPSRGLMTAVALLLWMCLPLVSQAPSAGLAPVSGQSNSRQNAAPGWSPAAAAPQLVTFQEGLLSIRAQGSTLAEVLQAVARATGATLDLPAGFGAERIIAKLGPAPAEQVVAALLNGSRYDYVLLNRAGNPGVLQSMLLREKSGPAPNGSGQQFAAAPAEHESPVSEEPVAYAPQPEEIQEGQGSQQAGDSQNQAPPGEGGAQAGGQQPRSAEQLVEELRSMQRRQRQLGQPEPQQQDAPPIPPQEAPH